MKSIFFTILCLSLIITVSDSALAEGKNSALDKIIRKEIHPSEYMLSDDYKSEKEIIREDILEKLTQMIKQDEYENLLDYLFFIVDISDKRYIPLLAEIEKRINSLAGVNIIGYSKFLELKISNVQGETMIRMIVNPDIGCYLFDDVATYVLSGAEDFDDKLNKFKILCEKTNFRYGYGIDDLLRTLCTEDPNKTDIFINSDKEFKKKLGYNCSSIKKAP